MTEIERALRDCKDLLNDIYEAVQQRQRVLKLFDDTMTTNFERQMIILMHKKDALFAEYGLD